MPACTCMRIYSYSIRRYAYRQHRYSYQYMALYSPQYVRTRRRVAWTRATADARPHETTDDDGGRTTTDDGGRRTTEDDGRTGATRAGTVAARVVIARDDARAWNPSSRRESSMRLETTGAAASTPRRGASSIATTTRA